jgi:hypothetical protein
MPVVPIMDRSDHRHIGYFDPVSGESRDLMLVPMHMHDTTVGVAVGMPGTIRTIGYRKEAGWDTRQADEGEQERELEASGGHGRSVSRYRRALKERRGRTARCPLQDGREVTTPSTEGAAMPRGTPSAAWG